MGRRSIASAAIAGAGSLLAGLGAPKVIDGLPAWVSPGLLGLGILLLLVAAGLRFIRTGKPQEDGGMSAATTGPRSPATNISNARDIYINSTLASINPPIAESPAGAGERPASVQQPPPEALVPDFFLGQLVARLLIHQGKVPDDAKEAEAYFLRMELEIADKVYQRNIAVWGRKGTEPAARLSKHDLHLVRIDARQCRLLLQREEGKPLFVYHHVTFNRGQVDEAWPEVTQND